MEYAEYRFRNWTPEETNEANQPDLYYLWLWFQRIAGAPSGGRFQEIAAFCNVTGIQLKTWEAETLMNLFALADHIARLPTGEQLAEAQAAERTLPGRKIGVTRGRNG